MASPTTTQRGQSGVLSRTLRRRNLTAESDLSSAQQQQQPVLDAVGTPRQRPPLQSSLSSSLPQQSTLFTGDVDTDTLSRSRSTTRMHSEPNLLVPMYSPLQSPPERESRVVLDDVNDAPPPPRSPINSSPSPSPIPVRRPAQNPVMAAAPTRVVRRVSLRAPMQSQALSQSPPPPAPMRPRPPMPVRPPAMPISSSPSGTYVPIPMPPPPAGPPQAMDYGLLQLRPPSPTPSDEQYVAVPTTFASLHGPIRRRQR
jgi:hypothetical protein